jgi:hypothetical protein
MWFGFRHGCNGAAPPRFALLIRAWCLLALNTSVTVGVPDEPFAEVARGQEADSAAQVVGVDSIICRIACMVEGISSQSQRPALSAGTGWV